MNAKQVFQNLILLITTTYLPIGLLIISSCSTNDKSIKDSNIENDRQKDSLQIIQLLDQLNASAANADFDAYFKLYDDQAIFTGTDAMERWDKKQFMAYAKPHFDKGKAWTFTSIDRHTYIHHTGDIAWFDELLSTQMKLCRGSGVVIKIEGVWKVSQYVLSITMPNDELQSAINLKTKTEDSFAATLRL